ncbi:MAG: protein kinase [Cyanobacteriota bacterium]|nr:protein kinase [Cyanobacteriota bacterium]
MPQISQLLNNRYRLHQHLSSNAGRQTWLAQDMTTAPPSRVVLKLLAFSPQMQWEEFQLFEREAEVLQSLKHPCLPRYRDYFSIDAREGEGLHWFALVQDYIPGKSLQQLLNQGYHFNEQQVQAIAVQVLKILHDLHSLNPPILHRDLKPSNLIVGLYAVKRTANQQSHTRANERRVYLIDFGTK